MLAVAQTNLQLYNQLLRLDYSHSDLGEVCATYDLARELFSGLFRPSGKTFIAHLVGTASILTECMVEIDVIKAGLMHAAYVGGDFGDRVKGVSDTKRDQLVAAIGARAEGIVLAYTQFQWPPADIDDFQMLASAEEPAIRSAALLRVANELEEHIDLGVCYCNERARKHISGDLTVQGSLTGMAESLGHPALAIALAEAFRTASNAEVPDVARSRQSSGKSILIPPRTYQKVFQLVASRIDT